MTNADAIARVEQINAERMELRTRVRVAESTPTPTLDRVEQLQEHMTHVQGLLCDLGVKDRMSLTLGDVTELLRMCRDIPV